MGEKAETMIVSSRHWFFSQAKREIAALNEDATAVRFFGEFLKEIHSRISGIRAKARGTGGA